MKYLHNCLPFDMSDDNLSGELKGIIDMRDGVGVDGYRGIPYYIKKLDEFTSTFATKMNEIYGQGNPNYKLFEEPQGFSEIWVTILVSQRSSSKIL